MTPRRAGRALLAGALVTALVALGAVLTPAVAGRGASSAPKARPALPAGHLADGRVCPRSTTASGASGQYGVAVEAAIDPLTFLDGYDEQNHYWKVRTSGVTAKACGLLMIPSLEVVVQPDGLLFDTSKEKIENFAGPAPGFPLSPSYQAAFIPDGDATTTVTGVDPGGELQLAARTPVLLRVTQADNYPVRFTCPDARIDTRLTTGSSTVVPAGRTPGPQWTVEGSPLSGPFIGASATVVSNTFAVPEFPTDSPAPGCDPGFILNLTFNGNKPDGDPWYAGPGSGPAPAGEGQVSGRLTVVSIDQAALPLGPPPSVPGTGTPTGDVIAPDCVPHVGAPYQLGAVGSFSGGGLTISDGVRVSDISGQFCAVATVQPPPPDRPGAKVCAAVTAPVDGIRFDPVGAVLSQIPGVQSVIKDLTITPESFTAFVCDDDLPGPIALRTTIRASAVPHLFGTGCLVGPVSAAVTGTLSGPLDDLSGSVASPPLPVATVQPGPLCPAGLAANTNTILSLPTTTLTGLTLDVHASLYLPPQT